MYKRFTLEELKTVQNNFVPNFFSIIKKESCILPSEFFKKVFRDWNSVYYFNRWEWKFRVSKENDNIILADEKEKIEIVLDEIGKREIQSIIKQYITKKERMQGQKSIEQILTEEFQKGFLTKILWKSYLVYDIETTSNLSNLKETKFLMAYSMESQADNTMKYEYISEENLDAFVKKMINFDWYIIGYNNIAFDNPVCIYNTNWTEEDLEKINQKSIDLFLFIQGLTGKRIGLNKVWEALVGVTKTLESWTQVETLLKKYKETGDKKFIAEAKQYCKNDVKMTALVLFYFLHYQKMFMEGKEITFWLNDLIEKSKHETKEEQQENWWQTNIFA